MIRRLAVLTAIASMGALLFAPQSYATSYPVTVTLAGTGGGSVKGGEGTINCPGDCSEADYSAGSGLSLAATPNATSLFGGWTGDCAFAGMATNCDLIVNGDTNIGATFNAIPVALPAPAAPHKKKCKKKKHRAATSAKKKCKKKRK